MADEPPSLPNDPLTMLPSIKSNPFEPVRRIKRGRGSVNAADFPRFRSQIPG